VKVSYKAEGGKIFFLSLTILLIFKRHTKLVIFAVLDLKFSIWQVVAFVDQVFLFFTTSWILNYHFNHQFENVENIELKNIVLNNICFD